VGPCANPNIADAPSTCVRLSLEGDACGMGFRVDHGDCEDGLSCECVGPCANPNIADAPSTCVRRSGVNTEKECETDDECPKDEWCMRPWNGENGGSTADKGECVSDDTVQLFSTNENDECKKPEDCGEAADQYCGYDCSEGKCMMWCQGAPQPPPSTGCVTFKDCPGEEQCHCEPHGTVRRRLLFAGSKLQKCSCGV